MKNIFIVSLKKIALTFPWQSGRKLACAVLMLAGATIPLFCSAQAVSWAHQNGSLQSNGSITIKSQSGDTYSGARNPVGAVAKTNQSAVTQPPTVIIQATSGSGYAEVIPYLKVGAPVPTCPTGYSQIFTYTGYPGYSGLTSPIFNAAGTRFSLISTGYYASNGSGVAFIGWVVDNGGSMTPFGGYPFQSNGNGYYSPLLAAYSSLTYVSNYDNSSNWTAILCSK